MTRRWEALVLVVIVVAVLCLVECSSVWLRGAGARDVTRPDPALTPGTARTQDRAAICRIRSASDARHVTPAMKRQVYARYGMANHTGACAGGCEIDHLVSLELGGSNDVENLWPEPYRGPHNAHEKDRLELRLHTELCHGTLTVAQAQHLIATDWIAAYRARFP